MTKPRPPIRPSVRDAVLREFNHHCAVCEKERPQLHHIDGDPSNNAPLNLIPLCPNCHLIDQHNSARPVEAGKLQLLRVYKDRAVLTQQFNALYTRMKFLNSVNEDADAHELHLKAEELIQFVAALEKGSFYARQIETLLRRPVAWVIYPNAPNEEAEHKSDQLKRDQEYREQLRNVKNDTFALIVELLNFQNWQLIIQ